MAPALTRPDFLFGTIHIPDIETQFYSFRTSFIIQRRRCDMILSRRGLSVVLKHLTLLPGRHVLMPVVPYSEFTHLFCDFTEMQPVPALGLCASCSIIRDPRPVESNADACRRDRDLSRPESLLYNIASGG